MESFGCYIRIKDGRFYRVLVSSSSYCTKLFLKVGRDWISGLCIPYYITEQENAPYFLCWSVLGSTSTHPSWSEMGWPTMKSRGAIGGVACRKSYCQRNRERWCMSQQHCSVSMQRQTTQLHPGQLAFRKKSFPGWDLNPGRRTLCSLRKRSTNWATSTTQQITGSNLQLNTSNNFAMAQ